MNFNLSPELGIEIKLQTNNRIDNPRKWSLQKRSWIWIAIWQLITSIIDLFSKQI